MQYRDLRDFLSQLEGRGLLRRIGAEVSPSFSASTAIRVVALPNS